VSQALERIRKAARERKKEMFTALFHHISIDLLDEVFYELKENAAAGVDGLTWQDIASIDGGEPTRWGGKRKPSCAAQDYRRGP
jgi:hypothetical protein